MKIHATRVLAALALVMSLLGCGQPPSKADPQPQPQPNTAENRWELTGTWVVDEVLCDTCGTKEYPEEGKRLTLSTSRIENPLDGNCERNPSYRFIERAPSARVTEEHGATWPAALKAAVQSQPTVMYGFVTCGDGNYMQVVQTQPDVAFYFLEGVVVRLKKQ